MFPELLRCLRLRMASSFLFAGRDKTSSSEAGSRTRHQSELAHTSHLRRKCAARRVWEYMFGTCTERCDVGFCFVFDLVWRCWSVHGRVAMSDFVSSLTWRCLVHAWRDATSDLVWRCLVRERRVCDVGFSSSLTWFSIGVVHGDRKVSMEAMVQLATSMHGEMRCRGFSSSLLGGDCKTYFEGLPWHSMQKSMHREM